MFIICAVIYLVGGVFYLIFVQAVTQPWATFETKVIEGVVNETFEKEAAVKKDFKEDRF